MPSNRRIEFSELAKDDLDDALQYTAREWSEDAARNAVESLADAASHIGRFPEIGRPRGDISTGLRSHIVGHHVVFYSTTNNLTTVLRIVTIDAMSRISSRSMSRIEHTLLQAIRIKAATRICDWSSHRMRFSPRNKLKSLLATLSAQRESQPCVHPRIDCLG